MSQTTYLIIAHGSREKQANEDFLELSKNFRKRSKHPVQPAFLELAQPSIPEGIEKCIAAGAMEIILIPLMLFKGRHVKEHIPQIIEEAKAKHPVVDFHYAGPLSEDPKILELLESRTKSAKGSL